MTAQIAESLAKAKIRKWHEIGSGWLIVQPTKLVVYRNRLFGKMEEAAQFEAGMLTRLETDMTKKSVAVTLEAAQGEPVSEVFSLSNGRDLSLLSSALSELLKAADDERRRRKDEVARREREAEEHKKQVRREFAADLWQTAELIWSLVKAVYSMENAIITGDWGDAKRQYSTIWQRADKLRGDHDIDLSESLKELDENISVGNGEAAITKTGLLLKALADRVVRTEIMWTKWRRDEITPSAMSPNWDHLPYFVLFAAGHFETILSSRIEDWAGVQKGLSVLRSSAPTLQDCFKVNLDGLLDAAESAGQKRDAGSIFASAGNIENAFQSSFKSRPFEYREPEQQPNGEHDHTLPESA